MTFKQNIYGKIGQPLSTLFTEPFPTSATKMGAASIPLGALHVGAQRSFAVSWTRETKNPLEIFSSTPGRAGAPKQ